MEHLKIFESFSRDLTIDDIEDIKLWLVELSDNEFRIVVNTPYRYADKIVDGLCIKIISRETYQINQIVEKLYFVTDMIKRKYNLDLSHISLLQNPFDHHVDYIQVIHSVHSFEEVVDSTITNDTALGIFYKPELKGVNKYVQKFLDFNPATLMTKLAVKTADKISSIIKK